MWIYIVRHIRSNGSCEEETFLLGPHLVEIFPATYRPKDARSKDVPWCQVPGLELTERLNLSQEGKKLCPGSS